VTPAEYYAAHPDFFREASPEDLPADLSWKDGMDQPVFASAEAVRGGTLRSFLLNFPPTVRLVGPDSNHSFRSALLDDNAVSLVARHPETGRFFAALAEAWAVLPDQQTVVYRLREDATFSDGEPVRTEDFFYLFYFMRSPHIQAPWYNNWYSTEYDGITRYDDRTFAIHLSTPKPEPLEFASVRPVAAHFYGTLQPDWVPEHQWQFEPTTGPYELLPENIQHGRSLRLTRVEDWWANDHKFYRHRFNPAAKHYAIVRDLNIAFERFKKGEFDLFGLTLPEYWYERSAEAEPFQRGLIRKAVFYNQRPRPSIGLWINEDQGYLANPLVRRGIAHAMDFNRVIEKHFRGDYARLQGTSDGFGAFTHPDLAARPYDIDRARELFAEAGFDQPGPDGILRNADGDRLSFTVTVSQGPREEVLQILREEARKAGLELNILSLEPTSAFKQILEKQHQIAFSGWNTSLPYPRYWEGFHSASAGRPQTNNITNTDDPELDNLIERYRASTSRKEKIALAHQLEELVHEEAVFIPGYYVPFYRVAYWRWIHFPEHFDVRLSQGAGQYGLLWIDQEERSLILAERRGDSTYENEVLVYDRYAPDQP
jgi:microcin C transport system substrate-binding protein